MSFVYLKNMVLVLDGLVVDVCDSLVFNWEREIENRNGHQPKKKKKRYLRA